MFDSEQDAIEAIYGNLIKPGDVVVIRYEGERRADAQMSTPSALAGMGLDKVP